MARGNRDQVKAANNDLILRRNKNTPKAPKTQINDIKLNEFGYPVLPAFGADAPNQKLRLSGQNPKNNGLRAYVENPTKLGQGRAIRGVLQKTEGIPYTVMRKIGKNFILHGMIMRLRSGQIRKFAVRSDSKDKPGFQLRMRDLRRSPTHAEQKLIEEAEIWLQQTGRRDFEGAQRRKDRLPQWTEKFVRDLLTCDRTASAFRFDRVGEMVDFAAIDGATIMPVNPYDGFDGDKNIEYVQEINGRVVEKFMFDELIVDWMYQTSEIENQHFGWSGIEEAFREIMATINALKYNSGNFTTNRTPRGFFSTDEEVDQGVLNDLEERFAALFSGADAAFRSPFFGGAANLRWNPIQTSNRDMEFTGYMNMLFSLYLAVFNVDPAELGLRFEQSAAMINNTGGAAAQGDRSKERGILDILEVKARVLNSILERTKKYKDLELIHTGTEIIDKSIELQQLQMMQSTIYSTDQLRATRDEKPLWEEAKKMGIDDEKILDQIKLMGSLPTSPTAMTVLSNILMAQAQKDQMEQQAQMQGDQGDMGGGEGQPDEGDQGGEGDEGDENQDLGDGSELPDYEEEGDEGGNEAPKGAINLTASAKPKEMQKSRTFSIEL